MMALNHRDWADKGFEVKAVMPFSYVQGELKVRRTIVFPQPFARMILDECQTVRGSHAHLFQASLSTRFSAGGRQ